MSALTRPRGPLPRRVYWVRRLLVLVVAVGLVVGIARLLTPGDGEEGAAALVAGRESRTPATSPTPTAPTPTAPAPTTSSGAAEPTGAPSTRPPRKKPLPRPDGPCDPGDVLVSPVAEDAHVNQPIEVVLEVSTIEAEACTFEVSARSVFVTIEEEDEGPGRWSSQECPAAMPTEEVVARRVKPARVRLLWNGRESAPGCPATTGWMLAGDHVATAIARGSTIDTTNDLVLQGPVAATITASPTPTPTPSQSPSREPR